MSAPLETESLRNALLAPRSDVPALAHRLLERVRIRCGKHTGRLVEIEFYHHGPGLEDPFAHCQPTQRASATWTLHRAGATSFRGGSWKGLDLTWGGPAAFGGILLRGIEWSQDDAPTTQVEHVEGPSLVVDSLLARLGCQTVAALHEVIGERDATDAGNGLCLLEPAAAGGCDADARSVYRSPRVGLGLKRIEAHPSMPRHWLRPDRFFTAPMPRKGRSLAVCWALASESPSEDDLPSIAMRFGSPLAAVRRWHRGVLAGALKDRPMTWAGRDLPARDVARAVGAWTARYWRSDPGAEV